jgi:tRNA nucleotidyltransferase (CCA-adding enzyme)
MCGERYDVVRPQTDPRARGETFPHGSDIGIRGIGMDMAQAFERAAWALTSVVTDPVRVAPAQSIEIACDAPDDDTLFYDWINALIYEMAVRRMLFSRFEVSVDGHRLRASTWGEPVDVVKHEPAVEVKGATWTELAVERGRDGLWRAQCVVDV